MEGDLRTTLLRVSVKPRRPFVSAFRTASAMTSLISKATGSSSTRVASRTTSNHIRQREQRAPYTIRAKHSGVRPHRRAISLCVCLRTDDEEFLTGAVVLVTRIPSSLCLHALSTTVT